MHGYRSHDPSRAVRLHEPRYRHAGLARAWLAQRGYDLALYDADVGTLDFGPRPWLRRPNVLAIARGARSAVLERLGDGPLHPPG